MARMCLRSQNSGREEGVYSRKGHRVTSTTRRCPESPGFVTGENITQPQESHEMPYNTSIVLCRDFIRRKEQSHARNVTAVMHAAFWLALSTIIATFYLHDETNYASRFHR